MQSNDTDKPLDDTVEHILTNMLHRVLHQRGIDADYWPNGIEIPDKQSVWIVVGFFDGQVVIIGVGQTIQRHFDAADPKFDPAPFVDDVTQIALRKRQPHPPWTTGIIHEQ